MAIRARAVPAGDRSAGASRTRRLTTAASHFFGDAAFTRLSGDTGSFPPPYLDGTAISAGASAAIALPPPPRDLHNSQWSRVDSGARSGTLRQKLLLSP